MTRLPSAPCTVPLPLLILTTSYPNRFLPLPLVTLSLTLTPHLYRSITLSYTHPYTKPALLSSTYTYSLSSPLPLLPHLPLFLTPLFTRSLSLYPLSLTPPLTLYHPFTLSPLPLPLLTLTTTHHRYFSTLPPFNPCPHFTLTSYPYLYR